GGPAHEPEYPSRLRALIGALGVGESVVLPGSQPPDVVARWLNAADLFCLPTFDEGCCNAILEALSCGVPVVPTPAGDNFLHIDPPRRGLIAPIGDVDALTEEVEAGLELSWDRDEIARYGSDQTWEEVARQTATFFAERTGLDSARAIAETSAH